jgi:hypothetical protein
MKYFFLLFLSILLFSSYSQKNNNDKPMENFKPLWTQNYVVQNIKPSQYQIPAFFERLSNLKGKIRRIEQKEFECKEDGKYVLVKGFLTFHILFNEENKIIAELSNEGKPLAVYKSYLERQTLQEKWLDRNGNVMYQIENIYYESGPLKTRIKYDSEGNEAVEHFKMEREKNEDYVIEHVGNREIRKLLNKGVIIFQETYEDDYLVSYISYNKDGSIGHEYIKVYDVNKNFIKGITKDDKDVHGFIERQDLYVYNSDNLFIEEKRLMQDGLFHSLYTNDYDHLGNIVRNGYNSHICEYKYDSHDNWTEKIEFKHSVLVRKTIRNIEYF